MKAEHHRSSAERRGPVRSRLTGLVTVLVILLTALVAAPAYAADGDIDTTFVPPVLNGEVRAMAELKVAPNAGKYLVGGSFTNVSGIGSLDRLVRLNTDGSRDSSFTPPANLSDTVYAVTELASGKYLVGGNFTDVGGASARDFVIRLNADGSLDTGFTMAPTLSNAVYSVTELASGNYLIGGAFVNVGITARDKLIRTNTAGTLDTGFNPPSNLSSTVYTVKELSSTQLLVGGAFNNVGCGNCRQACATQTAHAMGRSAHPRTCQAPSQRRRSC